MDLAWSKSGYSAEERPAGRNAPAVGMTLFIMRVRNFKTDRLPIPRHLEKIPCMLLAVFFRVLNRFTTRSRRHHGVAHQESILIKFSRRGFSSGCSAGSGQLRASAESHR